MLDSIVDVLETSKYFCYLIIMADNYLEKHYDDYLRRKAEWERKKKLGLIRPKSNGDRQHEKSSDEKS